MVTHRYTMLMEEAERVPLSLGGMRYYRSAYEAYAVEDEGVGNF